jgi:hypothetical protein
VALGDLDGGAVDVETAAVRREAAGEAIATAEAEQAARAEAEQARDAAHATAQQAQQRAPDAQAEAERAGHIALRWLAVSWVKTSDGAWPTTRRCPPGATASASRLVTSTIPPSGGCR